jgi:pyruvate dehydrogenase E1 component
MVDGEYQTFKARDGAYVREHFFGKYPNELPWSPPGPTTTSGASSAAAMIRTRSMRPMPRRRRTRVSPPSSWPRPSRATAWGRPARPEHHPPAEEDGNHLAQAFRDRFNLPVKDEEIEKLPFVKLPKIARIRYMKSSAAWRLGGYLPARDTNVPSRCRCRRCRPSRRCQGWRRGPRDFQHHGLRAHPHALLKDKVIGKRIVPIVPDESRTFGMEGLFRQIGIWNQVGQLYTPQDADQLMFYKEDQEGQILQEGINEAGAMLLDRRRHCLREPRRADDPVLRLLLDVRFAAHHGPHLGGGRPAARGFLIGGTAGRTTLAGEGLQHEDGHSQILAGDGAQLHAYDPTFSLRGRRRSMQDGLRRMVTEQEDVFYYLTVMNENYEHPAMPAGAEADILKGMYQFREGHPPPTHRACNCWARAPSCAKSWPRPSC